MLKSILIAIVVAIVVWALSFDFFFSYYGTVISFGVALAAGLITILILRAVTQKIFVHIVAIVLVVLAATFIASRFVPKLQCDAVSEVKVTCPPAVDHECILAAKGSTIVWNTQGLMQGVKIKIHKFKIKKFGIVWPILVQPLDKNEYPGDNTKNISAQVGNKSGTFKYSITCMQAGQQDKTKDPMFKVP